MSPIASGGRERIRSRPVGWIRGFVAAIVVVAVCAVAGPAGAAEEPADDPGVTVLDDADEAQPESEVVIDNETSDTVRRIRRELVAAGIVVSVALLVYIWHTSPRRRLRIAARRLDDVAAARDEPGGDAGEIDGEPGDDEPGNEPEDAEWAESLVED